MLQPCLYSIGSDRGIPSNCDNLEPEEQGDVVGLAMVMLTLVSWSRIYLAWHKWREKALLVAWIPRKKSKDQGFEVGVSPEVAE